MWRIPRSSIKRRLGNRGMGTDNKHRSNLTLQSKKLCLPVLSKPHLLEARQAPPLKALVTEKPALTAGQSFCVTHLSFADPLCLDRRKKQVCRPRCDKSCQFNVRYARNVTEVVPSVDSVFQRTMIANILISRGELALRFSRKRYYVFRVV